MQKDQAELSVCMCINKEGTSSAKSSFGSCYVSDSECGTDVEIRKEKDISILPSSNLL